MVLGDARKRDVENDVRKRQEALQLVTKAGTNIGTGWAEKRDGDVSPVIMFELERGPVFLILYNRDTAAALIDALKALLAKGPPAEAPGNGLVLPGGF